jgi:ATP-binding cassette subfamily B multidrug efflux pump
MQRDYGYFEEDHLAKPYDLRLLRGLFPYLRPYRFLFFLSVLFVCVLTVLDLALPYLTKVAIDRYIVQETRGQEPIDADRQHRHYRIDLRVGKNEKMVERYPGLFKVEGGHATIRYEDLAKLDRSDLSELRKADMGGVARIAVIFLGIVVCHFFFSFGNVLVLEYAGQSIMHDLRLRLFSHIQNLSVRFFSKNPIGRLVTRVTSDVQNMDEFFTSIITVLFNDVFVLLGIMVVLVVMNWKLALVCLTMLPVIVVTTVLFSRMARDVFRGLRIKIAQINSRIQESIDGISVIQLFSKEKKNFERFEKLNHENYVMGMRQINIFSVFMPVIEVLSSVTTALVVWYGGLRVLDDTLSLGVLVAFISYMRMFFRPIRDIAEKYNVMQSAMASCERIFLLFDCRDSIPEPREPYPPISLGGDLTGKRNDLQQQKTTDTAVAFERVWFAYEGDDWIIKDVSLAVREGETVAIVGPTGAGKSTLIHLLERFYDPNKGAVKMRGVDIRRIPTADLRTQMALITQDVFLFASTIRDNITAGNPPVSQERLDEIITGCNLDRVIRRLPEGIDTVLTEGGRTLSSGERQLIAFARALARDPSILILDEATSSVDSATEKLIQDATSRLMEGRTGIVVAHRLSTIRHADRIVVVHGGRIREVGTHEELLARKGLYYQLYQWQAIA